MNGEKVILEPTAVLLHTRDRQEDYDWFAEGGSGRLTEALKQLHRDLIADHDAGPASTLLLVDHKERVGLLVANLRTNRQDRLRTYINDTLVVEVDEVHRGDVLRLAAGLLTADAPAIRESLLAYAEAIFRAKQEVGGAIVVEPLTVPKTSPLPQPNELFATPHVGLCATEDHQRQVAGFVYQLAEKPFECNVTIISTGFVGREKLEEHVRHGERFIALTRSGRFPQEGGVPLMPAAELKKKNSRLPTEAVIPIAGLFALTALILLAAQWLLLGHRSNSSEAPAPSELQVQFAKLQSEMQRIEKRAQEIAEIRKELDGLREEVGIVREGLKRLNEESRRAAPHR